MNPRQTLPQPAIGERDHPLTPRQKEALSLRAQGLTQREIAKRMTIEIQTAKNHIEMAIHQLGARNSVHAVAIAIRKGLIH